ncbi:unnamed protein product, partial [marine sediment metagenome]
TGTEREGGKWIVGDWRLGIGYRVLDIGYWGSVSNPEIRLQEILGIR